MKYSQTQQEHRQKYSKCLACPLGIHTLSRTKNRRVFFGGSFPNDILFIGEAAGESELVTLEPFTGRAGSLLRDFISEVFGEAYWLPDIDPTVTEHPDYPEYEAISLGFTNSIVCPPIDPGSPKLRAPKNKELIACGNRLRDILYLSGTTQVVTCGRVAERAYKKLIDQQQKANFDDRFDHLVPENYHFICHPSAILRQEEAGVIDIKRTKDTLRKVLSILQETK